MAVGKDRKNTKGNARKDGVAFFCGERGHMDKKKIKRIIAREGLIFLCVIIVFLAYLFLPIPAESLLDYVIVSLITIGYPLYLFVRLIVWIVKKNKRDIAENKIRWYHKPLSIYSLAFLLGAFAIPLVWMSPLIKKERKNLFSLTMLLYAVMVFSNRIPKLWPLFYLIIVLLWFIKTEKK